MAINYKMKKINVDRYSNVPLEEIAQLALYKKVRTAADKELQRRYKIEGQLEKEESMFLATRMRRFLGGK